jgi:NitT/TauT family transport system ATP-binding protein
MAAPRGRYEDSMAGSTGPAIASSPRVAGVAAGRPTPAAVAVDAARVEFAQADGPPLVALERISLRVEPREIVALVGPNGCGKSTLLRVVGGLLRPVAGSVALDGHLVEGPDPAVGFVFQEARLLPWRDAVDNVALPLELGGMGRQERRARATEALRSVGLGRFGAYRPHRLSGGMRQRVALARALVLGPSILLLDEPFSALDALTRERFNVELRRLWDRTGTSILLVTHDIREALFLADRVLVMSPRPGRVLAEVTSPLGAERTIKDLDEPALGAAAAAIRAHLGFSGEEGDRPSEVTTDPALGGLA